VRTQKQQINNEEYRQIPLSEHLDICGNKKKIKIFPFYKFSGENDIQKREKEKQCIKFLSPNLTAKSF
jgi:hypothetical protein